MGEALEHCHVERALEIAKILADHLLGQTFSADEEARDTLGRVFEEAPANEVANSTLGFLVEKIQPYAILTLAYRFGNFIAGLRYRLCVVHHRQLVSRGCVTEVFDVVQHCSAIVCVYDFWVFWRARL